MKLLHGDCLELMKDIPPKSVDLILDDPPYGILSNNIPDIKGWRKRNIEWDSVINTDAMFGQIARILRPNGRCILFSQEPYTSELITHAIPSVPFSYKAIWKKNNAANVLGCASNMVSYFEDICIFSKICPKHDFEGAHPLRSYFMEEKEKCGNVDFRKLLGNTMASKHYFTNGNQFELPTKENYEKLQQTGHFKRDWHELKDIHEKWQKENIEKINSKYPSIFNLWQGRKCKPNVLEYAKDGGGFHPTQKPVLLLEDLIKTFSNAGDTVLDFTMGSGSTGVACVNTERNFIGMELDKKYFEIAKQRIEGAVENGH